MCVASALASCLSSTATSTHWTGNRHGSRRLSSPRPYDELACGSFRDRTGRIGTPESDFGLRVLVRTGTLRSPDGAPDLHPADAGDARRGTVR